jgi:LuxR family quorum sensing-dependent transcriptional regulator
MARNLGCAEIAFDFVERAEDLHDAEAVLTALKRAVETLGLTSFIVTGLPLPKRSLEPLVMLHAWPAGWYERYIERDYFRRDPVAQHLLTTSNPFRWGDVPSVRSGRADTETFMGEAREFGLADGYCVPIYSITGWQAAISFGSDRALRLGPRELAALHLLAITAYGRVRALHGQSRLPAPRLTPREREVLTWAAAGKSAWETSCILNVAEKTVRAHLESIRQKLNVATTTQAVAVALRSGDLQPY